jgi:hypothetical protein
MKNFYFYFSLFLFGLTSNVSAQYVRYGISGGINNCGISGAEKPDFYTKQIGWFGGFFLDNRIGEYLSVQTDLNISKYQFGFSENLYQIDNSLLTVNEKDYFVSVPLFLKYKRGYEFIFWDIGIGGQISVLVKSKRDLKLKVDNYNFDGTYYYNYENNWYDYGFTLNSGIQFKAVNLYVRYYYSMQNMYKYDDSKDINFNIFSFGASYQLNYHESYPYGRKTGWKGLKYKIKHLFK